MKKEQVLFDNYDADWIYSREDFNESLKERYSDEEIANFSESQLDNLYWEDYSDMESYSFNDVFDRLKDLFCNGVLLAKGSCGRWDGTSYGIITIGNSDTSEYRDFEDFFYSLSKDCDYYKICITTDNKISIQCSHHDGSNYVEFKVLTDKGEFLLDDYFEEKRLKDYSERQVFEKIWKSKVYSKKLSKDFNFWNF